MTEADRKQLNIRLNADGKAKLYALIDRMRKVLGIPTLSQSDVIHAALAALEKEYPPGCEVAGEVPPLPIKQTRRGRRPEAAGG